MDVRSYRRADCNSDHFLVRIKFKPKTLVSEIRPDRKIKRYDLTEFNEKSVLLKYREAIHKLLQESLFSNTCNTLIEVNQMSAMIFLLLLYIHLANRIMACVGFLSSFSS
jgi:hypothetical protein